MKLNVLVQNKQKENDNICRHIDTLSPFEIFGTVTAVHGLVIHVSFKSSIVSIGSRCMIYAKTMSLHTPQQLGEVIGYSQEHVVVMPYKTVYGISPGSQVSFMGETPMLYPSFDWRGRVINALAEPIDARGELKFGPSPYPLHAEPLIASQRVRIQDRINVGIRAINTFLTCCKGQRMGVFAGSGVGKSMLLSMFARFTHCDICIIGLIGERGREVQDFIEDTLGPEGLQKSIVVVATSDESPLMRRQAAFLTMTLAEYYRDQGLSVLCLMDSVTRFAMAQREIGLSAGEPPTTKGYTPSVFTQLSQLLERAGPGIKTSHTKPGYITGIFSVLVDADDTNEPISDAVRGILDGHIILERAIAERNRFPAINILKSISRTVPGCHAPHEQALIKKSRALMAVYEDMEDMIRLGAYKTGSNQDVDEAIKIMPALTDFLTQSHGESTSLEESFQKLEKILDAHIT